MAEATNQQEPAKPTKVTMVLPVEFTTNGHSYGPGKVEVPEEMADDLTRRVEEYNKIEAFRVTPGNYQQTLPAGSFSAGGK